MITIFYKYVAAFLYVGRIFKNNFTNILVQISNAPAVFILCHSFSPTKLHPNLPINTTRRTHNFYTLHSMLYAKNSCVNLLEQNLVKNIGEIDTYHG